MIDQLLSVINGLFLLKISFLILSGILFVFLLVVLKQAYAMQRVINDDSASSIVNGVALFNLFLGFLFFVTALVVL